MFAIALFRSPRIERTNLATVDDIRVVEFGQTVSLDVTLFRHPREEARPWEDKVYDIRIEGYTEGKSKPEVIATIPLNLVDYAGVDFATPMEAQYLNFTWSNGSPGQLKLVLRSTPGPRQGGTQIDDSEIRKVSKLKRISLALTGAADSSAPRLGRTSMNPEDKANLKRASGQSHLGGYRVRDRDMTQAGITDMGDLVYTAKEGERTSDVERLAQRSRRNLMRLSAAVGNPKHVPHDLDTR